MAELTYLQAISDGLRTEMRRDKRVFLIGEAVARAEASAWPDPGTLEDGVYAG